MLGVVSSFPCVVQVSCAHGCRDVAAGIAILREAGGLITSANPPPNPETDPIEEVRLGSRLYLAIRPAGDSEGETGRQAQERVVRETWKRVQGLDYTRPGA
jgi:myo-inositol-1(or 4)-monophosphatase